MASSRALFAIPLVLALPAPVHTAPPASATFSVSVTVATPCRLDAQGSVVDPPGCAPVTRRTQSAAITSPAPVPASDVASDRNHKPEPAATQPQTVLIRF